MERSSTGTGGGVRIPTGDGESGGGEAAGSNRSWGAKILSGTPREILARLVQGDPLGVRARVAARLRSDALLLDADRVHLRALARLSRVAANARGGSGLEAWVDQVVCESIEDLVREEHELARSRAVRKGDRAAGSGDPAKREAVATDPGVHATLAVPLGLVPASMRRACAAFDALPFTDRRAFFDLLLESLGLDEAARAAGTNASEVARRARRALDAILVIAFEEAGPGERAPKEKPSGTSETGERGRNERTGKKR